MTPFEPHEKPIDDHVRDHYASREPRAELLDSLAKAALAEPRERSTRWSTWRRGFAAAAVAVFAVAFVWKFAEIGPTGQEAEIVVPSAGGQSPTVADDGSREIDRDFYKAIVPRKNASVIVDSDLAVVPSKPVEESAGAKSVKVVTPLADNFDSRTSSRLEGAAPRGEADRANDALVGGFGGEKKDSSASLGKIGTVAESGPSEPSAGAWSVSDASPKAGDDVSNHLRTARQAHGGGGGLGYGTLGHGRSGGVAAREQEYAEGPLLVRPDRNEFGFRFDAGFERVAERPLSTFGVDVDTASYSVVKKYLSEGRRPPVDAVRIEELINAFRYDIPAPGRGQDFTVLAEAAAAPWNANHRLARIALATRPITPAEWPALNLVLLIDVSGSMKGPNKLPLAIESFSRLVNQMRWKDRIAIVTYAGESGVALPSTSGNNRDAILRALQNLRASGNTHGSAGLELAYSLAWHNHIPGGVNRVMLATDGDFNVGVTDTGSLIEMVRANAAKGVDLTVLGFGSDNLKDARLEAIADRSDGNYAFIGSRTDAERVLVQAAGATLITAAHDVKVQVEFNPAMVEAYRLIGYENRALASRDFADDRKDAGDVGYGHTVTALYELVPRGGTIGAPPELRYRSPTPSPDRAIESASPESFYVKVRYQPSNGDGAREFAVPFVDDGRPLAESTDDMRWVAAVAAYGMWLRDPNSVGSWTDTQSRNLAAGAIGDVDDEARYEFVDLIGRWWR
ncbi:MAG: von Willebrand factor type A domain-containing protein [Deltaproteobacteria bacterium]|nr:von Willebrand factor type A domain-containing protein [Deltaproteobacteria bacterium]